MKMAELEKHDFGAPTIPEYYRDKTIFITGGTGFIGKLLIEKLLYSCPELKQILIFVRDKKGVSPEERVSELYRNCCFDRLRNERSGIFQSKVRVVSGSMTAKGLGLSEKDRALVIEHTNVIIHSAATVRFDESLKESFDINVLGALRLIELAKAAHHLECYVHVSTAFCNLDYEPRIQERLYPAVADWRAVRDIVQLADDDALRVLTPKLLGKYPNSYVFTKNMAEHVVYEQKGILPVIIVRPSIVTGCMSEPVPGWIDNFNGPAGLLTSAVQGVLRVAYADEDADADYVPADIVVNGTLAAAWQRGIKRLQVTDDVTIYNACMSAAHCTSMAKMRAIGQQVAPDIALENTVRPCDLTYVKSKFIFKLYVLMFHVLPALAVDFVLRALGNKPKLLKVQRRTMMGNLALEYFTTRSWNFVNDNFVGLRALLGPTDQQFSFSLDGANSLEYWLNSGLRAREDLLRQDPKTLAKWRKIYKWGEKVDTIITYIVYGCVLWWILKRFSSAYGISI